MILPSCRESIKSLKAPFCTILIVTEVTATLLMYSVTPLISISRVSSSARLNVEVTEGSCTH